MMNEEEKPDSIHLDAETVAEYARLHAVSGLSAAVAEVARTAEVPAGDAPALRAHLIDAHGFEDSDLFRNSHPEDHPALGRTKDTDRRLSEREVVCLHAWEHLVDGTVPAAAGILHRHLPHERSRVQL